MTRQNVAASANGGTATASQTHSAPYSPSGTINGDRKLYLNNNAWSNSTATFPQWLQVDFNGSKDIDEINVFSVQDLYNSPSDPTLTMTFGSYGLTAFQAQYWNGSAWVTVPNGNISGNSNVWKQITFAPLTTTKIRIWITGSSDSYSRTTEVEAWGVPTGSGGPSTGVQWLISDHLGTPRMVLDQTGNLNTMKRHDYLPFGEELVAPTGGRTATQGYAGGDGVRQQFTSQERDVETAMDYFNARHYGNILGRFTSPDPLVISRRLASPQSWNRYSYVQNKPLRLVDPTGLTDCTPKTPCVEVPISEWDTVGPVINAGSVEVGPPTLTEVFTSNEISSEITPRPTQPTTSDDCLYCASLAQEMHRRAVPMAEVIQTYAEIDVAVITMPLALGGGATRLGLSAATRGAEAAEAGGAGFDLALGLGEQANLLAEETGSLTYGQVLGDATFVPENFTVVANEEELFGLPRKALILEDGVGG